MLVVEMKGKAAWSRIRGAPEENASRNWEGRVTGRAEGALCLMPL